MKALEEGFSLPKARDTVGGARVFRDGVARNQVEAAVDNTRRTRRLDQWINLQRSTLDDYSEAAANVRSSTLKVFDVRDEVGDSRGSLNAEAIGQQIAGQAGLPLMYGCVLDGHKEATFEWAVTNLCAPSAIQSCTPESQSVEFDEDDFVPKVGQWRVGTREELTEPWAQGVLSPGVPRPGT